MHRTGICCAKPSDSGLPQTDSWAVQAAHASSRIRQPNHLLAAEDEKERRFPHTHLSLFLSLSPFPLKGVAVCPGTVKGAAGGLTSCYPLSSLDGRREMAYGRFKYRKAVLNAGAGGDSGRREGDERRRRRRRRAASEAGGGGGATTVGNRPRAPPQRFRFERRPYWAFQLGTSHSGQPSRRSTM